MIAVDTDRERCAEVFALRCVCWQNGYRPLAVYSPGAKGTTVILPLLSTVTLRTRRPSFETARTARRRSVSLNLRGPLLITHLSDQPPRAPGGRPARRQGRLRGACR